MPFNLREIASIAGMSGLYRIVKPTRTGVIIESLEEQPTRGVAQARQRISLLEEISVYTTDADSTIPLREVFDRIRNQYGDELPVNPKSSGAELADFIEEIVPDYDQERVYTSDMKKIVSWYTLVNKFVPYTEESAEGKEEAQEAPVEEETAEEPKAKNEKKK